MKLEINKPDITAIEIKSYILNGTIRAGNMELANEQSEELIAFIQDHKRLMYEWHDLLFAIANKF